MSRETKCLIAGCSGIHYPDLPLLRKIFEYIEAHPEEWDQGSWGKAFDLPPLRRLRDERGRFTGGFERLKAEEIAHCGTSFCVAGHATNLAGANLVKDGSHLYTEGLRVYAKCEYQGRTYYISELARHLLGLTEYEADNLFAAGNDFDDVREYCEEIASTVGEVFLP